MFEPESKASAVWRSIYRPLVAAAALLNVIKCLPTGLQVIGWTQYQISYKFGFVRRGLIGTLYQTCADGWNAEDQQRQILGIHVALVLAIAVGVLAWYRRTANEVSAARKRLLLAGAASFLLAPGIPTMFVLAGYFDVYLAGLTLLAAWALRRRKTTLLVGVGFVGPFVHDAFVFWWLVIVCLALVETSDLSIRDRLRRLWPLAVPFLVFPIVMILHRADAVPKIAASLLSPEAEKDGFVRVVYNLPILRALPYMAAAFRNDVENVIVTSLYTLPMSVWLAVSAVRALPIERRSRSNKALVVLASFAPSLVLMVAWDLSRLMSWSAFGGAIALGWSADFARTQKADEPEPAPLARHWQLAAAAVLAAAAAFAIAPLMFTYFHMMSPSSTLLPSFTRSWPTTKLVQVLSIEYNRRLFAPAISIAEKCDAATYRAEKLDGKACSWHVTEEGVIDVPGRLRPGRYRASAIVRVPPTCEKATGSFDALSWWRYVDVTRSSTFEVLADGAPHRIELPFEVNNETAAFGTAVVRTRVASGCLDVLDVRADPE